MCRCCAWLRQMQSHRMRLAMPPSNHIWILAVVRSNVCWCGEMSDEVLQIRKSILLAICNAIRNDLFLLTYNKTFIINTFSSHKHPAVLCLPLCWLYCIKLKKSLKISWGQYALYAYTMKINPLIISGVINSLRMSWQQLLRKFKWESF